MRTNRTIRSAIAAFLLLLPAYASATVWHLQDVVVQRHDDRGDGFFTGQFNASGNTITAWDIKLFFPGISPIAVAHFLPIPCHFDPVRNGCDAPVQTASMVSSTHMQFEQHLSPSSAMQLDLILSAPLGGGVDPITITAQSGAFVANFFGDERILSGTITAVPEPQLYVVMIAGLLLVFKLGKAQARTREHLRCVA